MNSRFFASLSALTLLAAVGFAQDNLPAPPATQGALPQGAGQGPLATEMGQTSYTIGLQLGQQLKSDGLEIDINGLMAGINDALQGAQPQLSEEQIKASLMRIQQFVQQQQQKAQAEMAANAKDAAPAEDWQVAFMDVIQKQDPSVQTTASGLKYRVMKKGAGPKPTARSVVACHYDGKLPNGEVFDSSYKRGEPAQFPVNRVIPGWTEALQLMSVGEKWEVYLPSAIAYGAEGTPGGPIGPNQDLLFTIELLGIVQ